MTTISEFELTDTTLGWRENGKGITINLTDVSQAVVDAQRDLVFALVGKGNDTTLNIYSVNGTQVAVIKPPDSFCFSYLTEHPAVGVAVVAGANEKVDGWYDWHYGFDVEKKCIFRHCPAY